MKAFNGLAINTHLKKIEMNKCKLCFYLMVDNCFFMIFITLDIKKNDEKKERIKSVNFLPFNFFFIHFRISTFSYVKRFSVDLPVGKAFKMVHFTIK